MRFPEEAFPLVARETANAAVYQNQYFFQIVNKTPIRT
jgi:hypothetical protein